MLLGRFPTGIIVLIVFHIFNVLIWFFGQTLAVFDYDMVAGWGLQEPRDLLDPAIVEVNRAIGLSDSLIMLPLFAVAAFGLAGLRFYGAVASWVVLGCSVYWPVIFWTSQAFYASAGITHAPTTGFALGISGAIWLTSAWGIWYLYRNRALFN